jgi:hypothetical protein
MRPSQEIAAVALFTAMILGSNFVLTDLPNAKLLDSMVFVAAFLFGLRVGASVAIVSETAWAFVSPWGSAGVLTPFLVGGELLFAVAGWATAKVWGDEVRSLSPTALVVGATLTLCAFLWDLETNAASALLASWPDPTMAAVIGMELSGVIFALVHEASDFLLGVFFVPVAIALIPRIMRRGA